MVIQGEPGSGRTHLMRAMGSAALDRGYTVVGCEEPLALDPTTRTSDLARALSAILGRNPPALAETRPRWARLLGEVKAALGEERDLVEQFAQGPLLIAVDGYAPSSSLERWLLGPMLDWLAGADTDLVVVLVDREERVAKAREKADLVLPIGVLDPAELADYFSGLAGSVSPPLTADEIESYAEASRDPAMFAALDIVLRNTVRGVR